MYLKEGNWIVYENQQEITLKIHIELLKGIESVSLR